jgi:uncharacterized protein YjbI with pentapeptide repeats
MIHRLASHARGNAVAYVALFVALTGTAWAAATIGPRDIKSNAVRSRHIKDGGVKSADVNDATLQGGDVKDETLTGTDIQDDSLKGADVDESSLHGLVRDATGLGLESSDAYIVSDETTTGADQGSDTIATMPGIGHFAVVCSASQTNVSFVNDSGITLLVWQDSGGSEANTFELTNGQSTTVATSASADTQGDLITYRIARGQQQAPEYLSPMATVIVTVERSTPTIPDLCDFVAHGFAQ